MFDRRIDSATPIRLAAIDLDGTLLGPEGRISAENLDALRALAEAGIEVVLASGRHYCTMIPYAEKLPMVRWMVTTQGAEVGSKDRTRILRQAYLPAETVGTINRMGAQYGFTDVNYLPQGVFTTRNPDTFLNLYAGLSGRIPAPITPETLLTEPVYKVVWLGEPQRIRALGEDPAIRALGLQWVQTHDSICELMPLTTTKAAGVEALAAHLDIPQAAVAAFGDGDNDIPLFDWAGLSYAMPHGWPLARKAATRVGPEAPPETAFARAVEDFFARYA